jgi:hypothetical protein
MNRAEFVRESPHVRLAGKINLSTLYEVATPPVLPHELIDRVRITGQKDH